MKRRKMTKNLTVLLLSALSAALLLTPALAVGENITDRVREALQTEVASVSLYEPYEDLDFCGELEYNDSTATLQYAADAETVAPVNSIVVTDLASAFADEESADRDKQPAVPEGYVLVQIAASGLEDVFACMEEQYSWSAEERAAARETLEAPTEEENTEALAELDAAEAAETPQPELPAETQPPAETELTTTSNAAPASDSLSKGLIVIVSALALLLVIVLELVLLIRFKNRAENVARNYIRAKSALERTKRELSAEKTRNLQLERQLLDERQRMSAVREQVEKLDEIRRPKHGSAEESPELPETKKDPSHGYDLNYLDWM